ncbi:hypothetical protein ACIQ1D_19400 [Lysinibacillus xylanilyticus]|uniref:hypothetical protein n=1 Tax=Lysinibacillus xylanilyticus TaxID=582475 RepID=UPI00381918B9
MGKIVIQDTADVKITDLVTGKVVLNAEAQLAGIKGSISEDDLKGGIGNKKLYKIRTDKAIDLSMRSAVADIEYWAMTQGVAVEENGKGVFTADYKGVVVEDSATSANEIVLPVGAIEGTKAQVALPDGTQETLEVVKSLTAPTKFAVDLAGAKATFKAGQEVTVFYQEEVEGQRISIDSTKFAGKYRVEMKTIAYDLDTAKVTAEILFDFPETIPSGEFDISLENGNVYTPEINFSVLNPKGSDEMGSILLKPRK